MCKWIWAGLLLEALMFTSCNRQPQVRQIRIATFNIWELSLEKLQDADPSGAGINEQVRAAADIIQKIRPDILVLNEIDHVYGQFDLDLTGPALQFVKAYLNTGKAPIDYPYLYTAPCNTGIPSGRDLNGDGLTAQMGDPRSAAFAADCFGWGEYPGQYSMVLLSRYPVEEEKVRTFQKTLWKDLPGNHLPMEYYGGNADILRLSSKSHWDVPVKIGDGILHLFLCHPTPPGFDGPEDRNGRRNFDELKFWVEYLKEDGVLIDDQGRSGGYTAESPFILAGDFNADPSNEPAYEGMNAIHQLLTHPKIQDTSSRLISEGGGAFGRDPGAPDFPERYTAKFGEDFRMRIDYLLPSKDVNVLDGGVFWPSPQIDADGYQMAEKASDHRLLWLDLRLPQAPNKRE